MTVLAPSALDRTFEVIVMEETRFEQVSAGHLLT